MRRLKRSLLKRTLVILWRPHRLLPRTMSPLSRGQLRSGVRFFEDRAVVRGRDRAVALGRDREKVRTTAAATKELRPVLVQYHPMEFHRASLDSLRSVKELKTTCISTVAVSPRLESVIC